MQTVIKVKKGENNMPKMKTKAPKYTVGKKPAKKAAPKKGLTAAQKKLPPALQKAILKKMKGKK